MKLTYDLVSKIERKKETAYIYNKQIRIELKAWNTDQIGNLGSIIKKVVRFAFVQFQDTSKENVELSEEAQDLKLDKVVDFLIDNLSEVKQIIYVSLNRKSQNIHLIDLEGNEIKAFDEVDEQIVDELEPDELWNLTRIILKLNLQFLFGVAKENASKTLSNPSNLDAKKKEG